MSPTFNKYLNEYLRRLYNEMNISLEKNSHKYVSLNDCLSDISVFNNVMTGTSNIITNWIKSYRKIVQDQCIDKILSNVQLESSVKDMLFKKSKNNDMLTLVDSLYSETSHSSNVINYFLNSIFKDLCYLIHNNKADFSNIYVNKLTHDLDKEAFSLYDLMKYLSNLLSTSSITYQQRLIIFAPECMWYFFIIIKSDEFRVSYVEIIQNGLGSSGGDVSKELVYFLKNTDSFINEVISSYDAYKLNKLDLDHCIKIGIKDPNIYLLPAPSKVWLNLEVANSPVDTDLMHVLPQMIFTSFIFKNVLKIMTYFAKNKKYFLMDLHNGDLIRLPDYSEKLKHLPWDYIVTYASIPHQFGISRKVYTLHLLTFAAVNKYCSNACTKTIFKLVKLEGFEWLKYIPFTKNVPLTGSITQESINTLFTVSVVLPSPYSTFVCHDIYSNLSLNINHVLLKGNTDEAVKKLICFMCCTKLPVCKLAMLKSTFNYINTPNNSDFDEKNTLLQSVRYLNPLTNNYNDLHVKSFTSNADIKEQMAFNIIHEEIMSSAKILLESLLCRLFDMQ